MYEELSNLGYGSSRSAGCCRSPCRPIARLGSGPQPLAGPWRSGRAISRAHSPGVGGEPRSSQRYNSHSNSIPSRLVTWDKTMPAREPLKALLVARTMCSYSGCPCRLRSGSAWISSVSGRTGQRAAGHGAARDRQHRSISGRCADHLRGPAGRRRATSRDDAARCRCGRDGRRHLGTPRTGPTVKDRPPDSC